MNWFGSVCLGEVVVLAGEISERLNIDRPAVVTHLVNIGLSGFK